MSNKKTAPDGTRADIQDIALQANRKINRGKIQGRPLTDLGNAERFVDLYSNDVLYDHSRKAWLIYDGRRWADDEKGAILGYAVLTVRHIYPEAKQSESEDERKKIADWGKKSEDRARLWSLLELSKNSKKIAVTSNDLDRDNWLLNVENGTIDLRTGGLRPHGRQDRITKLAAVSFDRNATCPRWSQFLAEIQDTETTYFLKVLAGYCLTGDIDAQIFPIFFGHGANGKSVFLGTLQGIFGDYAGEVSPETLMESTGADGGKSASPELARTYGKRLILASESKPGSKLNEALIKLYTGGEKITARFLYGNPFSFIPTAKLILMTNHKPKIPGGGHSIWRRLRQVPFETKISDDQRDDKLTEKLKAEWPGILNWMLEGLIIYQEKGLPTVEPVRKASAEYAHESDIIGRFLDDSTQRIEGEKTPASTLYQRYSAWCETEGEFKFTGGAFKQAIEEHGFAWIRLASGRFYRDLSLKTRTYDDT